MTTTSTGAGRVIAQMEDFIQTEWPDLKVWFTSTTEQWATIAINGPRAREMLTRSQSPEQAAELAELLATGTWTHDFPITVEVAQRLGLKVRSDIPEEVLELMSLYPQPVRRQPSVEYIPTRRHAEPSTSPTGTGRG